LTILQDRPNFLVLDEPTNDLDLVTISVLENFLMTYKGCLIVISHDRFFMDKITDHLFIFEGDGIVEDFW
jgi:ATP-binding cassette subfamily F protein uup